MRLKTVGHNLSSFDPFLSSETEERSFAASYQTNKLGSELLCGSPENTSLSSESECRLSTIRIDRFAPAEKVGFPPITSKAWRSNPYTWQRPPLHINLGISLSASPARLRVSQGRTALRTVAHSAVRPHRGVAPRPPVFPPREHVPPRPLRRIALWSVLA